MRKLFDNYNIDLSDDEIEKFQNYYELLIDWNEKINLTTITRYEEVIKKHFLDSVLILSKMDKAEFDGKSIIDVGTGAGFPGIPLAILLSNTKFTLIDSLRKRIDFLSIVIKEIGLTNVSLVHGRAEELGRNEIYREMFDLSISRAVASLPILLEYCSPFIKKNGELLLYKSLKSDKEIEDSDNALNKLNCKVRENLELCNEDEYYRSVVIIDKFDSTPDKYPRNPGKPKKKPL